MVGSEKFEYTFDVDVSEIPKSEIHREFDKQHNFLYNTFPKFWGRTAGIPMRNVALGADIIQ